MRALLLFLASGVALAPGAAPAQLSAFEEILHRQHLDGVDLKEPWRKPALVAPSPAPPSAADAAQLSRGCTRDASKLAVNPDNTISPVWNCPPSK